MAKRRHIDERDLRVACGRLYCDSGERLLREIRNAQLEREIAELNARIDAELEALKPAGGAAELAELLARHDTIDRLWKRLDRLSDERWPKRDDGGAR